MAARTVRLLQDQNLGVHMDGTAISGKQNYTGQRKAGPVGRKPLGDLSNSGKLSINQADGRKALDRGKQLKSKKLATVKEEELATVKEEAVVPAKLKNIESTRTASKVSEKLQTGNRKALSDISNVGKTKNKSIQKPSALTEEPLQLSAIAEEGWLHNHQECIKSQSQAMGLSHFFKTVGLESDSDDHLAFSSEEAINKLKPESDLKHLELEYIPEMFPEEGSSCKKQFFFLATHLSSPAAHCMTPKISSCYKMWEDCDVNFKLMDTPELHSSSK